MLAIPLKRSQVTDVGNPLHEYLVNTFDQGKANLYLESYSAFTTAREKFLNLADKRSTGVPDLQVANDYFRALSIVDAKFPVDENHMKMRFIWHDSFQLSTRFEYNRLSAERAAALFNLAALYSRIAITLDRSNDENLTQACEYFRTAGTIFEYLKEEYLPSHSFGAVTADLSEESLQMLKFMMLAQAQVCVFEKGCRNKMSSSVLSKLAKGSSEMYDKAFRLSGTTGLKTVLAASWGNHLLYQSVSFKASSFKHYAKFVGERAEKNAEGFGEHIAWLQLCLDSCREALQIAAQRSLPVSVQRPIQSMMNDVQKDIASAVEDNQKIYLEIVPPKTALKAFESKIIVSSQPEKLNKIWKQKMDLNEERDDDIFFGLLPLAVEKIVSTFEVKVNDIRNNTEKIVRDGVGNIRAMLKEANLPMLIEAGEKAVDGVPDETYARILAVVHERGGVQTLLEALDDNAAKNASLREIVDGTAEKLRKDQDSYAKYKNKYGSKWSIPDATEASNLMRKDCLKFRGYLAEGAKNDDLLRQKLTDGELGKLLKHISSSKEDLDKLMPSDAAIDDDPQVEKLRTTLRFSYIELDEKLASSTRKLENLKIELSRGAMDFAKRLIERDDIDAIVNNSATLNEMIEIELTNFVESVSEVTGMMEGFTPLLSRVLDDSAKYMQSRKSNAVTQQRVDVLNRLEHGIVEFDKMARNIDEGRGFYANLSVKVERVRGLVDDHVLSRTLISDELAEALARSGTATTSEDRPPAFGMLGRQKSEPVLNVHEGNPPRASRPNPQPQQQHPPLQQQQQQPGYYQQHPYPTAPPAAYGGYPYGAPPPNPYPAYGGYPPYGGYGGYQQPMPGYPAPGGYGGYPPPQGYYGAPPQQQPPPQGDQGGQQPGRFERMFSRRNGF